MPTPSFRQRFCAAHRLSESDFVRKVFWQCVPWHRRAQIWFVALFRPTFCEADQQLLLAIAEASSMDDVHDELHHFRWLLEQGGWWRWNAKLRMSTRRLELIAQRAALPDHGLN